MRLPSFFLLVLPLSSCGGDSVDLTPPAFGSATVPTASTTPGAGGGPSAPEASAGAGGVFSGGGSGGTTQGGTGGVSTGMGGAAGGAGGASVGAGGASAGAGGASAGSGGGSVGGAGGASAGAGGTAPVGPPFTDVHEIFRAKCSGGSCHSAGDQGAPRVRFAASDVAAAEEAATGMTVGSVAGMVPAEILRRVRLTKGDVGFMPAGPAGMSLPQLELSRVEAWATAQETSAF